MIGVFNRSHYEDVVTARVHDLVQNGQLPESVRSSKNVWDDRYRQISNWEKYLHDNGFYMIKVFLNISKEEQAKRLAERLFDKNKHYKFEMSDITEREYWEDYQRLYAEVMTRSSTSEAPWFVVPADKKWFSSYVVALIVRDALKAIDPQFPVASRKAGEARGVQAPFAGFEKNGGQGRGAQGGGQGGKCGGQGSQGRRYALPQ